MGGGAASGPRGLGSLQETAPWCQCRMVLVDAVPQSRASTLLDQMRPASSLGEGKPPTMAWRALGSCLPGLNSQARMSNRHVQE